MYKWQIDTTLTTKKISERAVSNIIQTWTHTPVMNNSNTPGYAWGGETGNITYQTQIPQSLSRSTSMWMYVKKGSSYLWKLCTVLALNSTPGLGKKSWRKRRRRREQSCCCPTAPLPTPLLPCHIAEVSVDAGVHQFTLRPTSCSPRAPVANIIRPSNGMLTSRYVRCYRINPCRSWTKF